MFFYLFIMAGMGWHIDNVISTRTGSDQADIWWYGGCVGVWCEHADMAGGPRGCPRGLDGSRMGRGMLTGWHVEIECGQVRVEGPLNLDNVSSEGWPVEKKGLWPVGNSALMHK